MNSALTPWMYSKIKKGDIRSMRKVLQLLSVVVVGIAVALMLISPEPVSYTHLEWKRKEVLMTAKRKKASFDRWSK